MRDPGYEVEGQARQNKLWDSVECGPKQLWLLRRITKCFLYALCSDAAAAQCLSRLSHRMRGEELSS